MIVREDGSPGAEPEPLARAVMEQIGASPHRVLLAHRANGFEIRMAPDHEGGEGGRPRIRFFAPPNGGFVAFFHKPSRLDFSRDRFSYGVVHLRSGDGDEQAAMLTAALDYLASGLRPSARPAALRRSFPFDVPAD